MLKLVLILVLCAILALALLAAALGWLVKSNNKKKRAAQGAAVGLETASQPKLGVCSMCGEKRIIVNEGDLLCAFCYSSLRTKKLE